jgi:hypothetical protein
VHESYFLDHLEKKKKVKKFKKNYMFNFDLEKRESFDKIQNF